MKDNVIFKEELSNVPINQSSNVIWWRIIVLSRVTVSFTKQTKFIIRARAKTQALSCRTKDYSKIICIIKYIHKPMNNVIVKGRCYRATVKWHKSIFYFISCVINIKLNKFRCFLIIEQKKPIRWWQWPFILKTYGPKRSLTEWSTLALIKVKTNVELYAWMLT